MEVWIIIFLDTLQIHRVCEEQIPECHGCLMVMKLLPQRTCLIGKQGVTAAFTKDMKLAVSKEVFLSNKKNKQKFIHMLGNELQMLGAAYSMKKQIQTTPLFKKQFSILILKQQCL